MASLLAQFYSRIKGSQEDLASEGLTYILQRSSSARNALRNIFSLHSGITFGNISYLCQAVGEHLERPDISGIDENGNEVVMVEAKFWASLTDNQPLKYLERLGGNSVLMFVCPSLRARSIFEELHIRFKKAAVDFQPNFSNNTFVFQNNQHLIVKTWQEVLGSIRIQLVQDSEHVLLSDIDQIIGLCELIDSNAFLPYQSEDFAPAIAKKINSYYDLTDKVVDELKKRGLADTANLNATPQKYGYTRYFKIFDFGLALNVRFDFWEKVADTPFWLCIKDDTSGKGWIQNEYCKTLIKSFAVTNSLVFYETPKRELHTALFPLLNQTEDCLVNDFAAQIVAIVSHLNEKIDKR